MSLTSRVAAAQDALRSLLAARAALTGVSVDVGEPDVIEAEHIWLGETVDDWDQEQETTGNIATAIREETFSLPVFVIVKGTYATFAEVRDRAMALAGEVEKQCRENHTLGAVIDFCQVLPVAMDGGKDGSQRICGVQLDVDCRAYLA